MQKVKLLSLLLIVGVIAYVLVYQNVINERVKLEDEHCMKVNPLIIQRKTLYLDSMKALLKSKDIDQYDKINAQYISVSNKYIKEEDEWLKNDQSMISSPLVKLVISKDGYQGALMSHRMYELDFINTKNILRLFHEKDKSEQEKLSKSLVQNTIEFKKLNNDYDKISNLHNYRWVDYLIKVPQSECPAVNRNIPDVERELQKLI